MTNERQDKAIMRLDQTAQAVTGISSRLDDIADTLLACIAEVRAGTMKPQQGNSIALLCSTLIKAMEAARGNTPAVSITAQLSKSEIEEILHGRDPFRPTITIDPPARDFGRDTSSESTTARDGRDSAPADRINDTLPPATGTA